MKSHRPLAWVLGFTAFVMNPAFGCSSSSPDADFQFGEKEMTAAVQGTWRLTYAHPEGTGVVTFTVAPGPASNGGLASPPGLVPQCGNRTFTRPAAACSPTSQLRVIATVVDAEPPLDSVDGAGWFTTFGVQYSGGNLELTFGANLRASAAIDASDKIRQSYVDWQGARVTSLLERIALK